MATKRKVEGEEVRYITEVPTGTFIRTVSAKTGKVSSLQRVYVLDGYDRSLRKYVAHAFNDVNQEIFLASTRKVLVGFTF